MIFQSETFRDISRRRERRGAEYRGESAHNVPPLFTEALRVWSAKGATLFWKTARANQNRGKYSASGQFFTRGVLRVWSAKCAAPRAPAQKKTRSLLRPGG